jgi:hypothetical protein
MATGIEIITQFDLKKKEALDSRQRVADQTARLALTWYYKGLLVKQADTGVWYEYIGGETTNLSTDWILKRDIHSGSGAPANELGTQFDIYIDESNRDYYRKTGASTWTLEFTFKGDDILIGTIEPPNNGVGKDGDLMVVNNGKVYKKVSGAWVFHCNIKGADGDQYQTVSTTSVNLSTATAPLSITVETGLAWTPGQTAEVVATASPATNKFIGVISAYNKLTGLMTFSAITITGSATIAAWTVNLSGATGRQGKGFVHNEANITLTQAKISSIQAGGYTAQNNWSASVSNDTRTSSQLTSTPNIVGSMVGHSITWDGTRWWDNGTWRGPTGLTGPQGATGPQGVQGVPGAAGSAGGLLLVYNFNGNFTVPAYNYSGSSKLLVTVILRDTRVNSSAPCRIDFPQNNLVNYRIILEARYPYNQGKISIGITGGGNIIGTDGSIFAAVPWGGLPQIPNNGNVNIFVFDPMPPNNNSGGYILTSCLPEYPDPIYIQNRVDSGILAAVSSKTYPGVAYTSLRGQYNLILDFWIHARHDSGGQEEITLQLQRSGTSDFASSTILATTRIRLDGDSWTMARVVGVQQLGSYGTYYYRVVGTNVVGGGCFWSNDFGCLIHRG